ncbi:ati2 chaperone [Vibrio tubiashii]|uniref:ati2 chaperone n=1 Tax=Vibrio tubiashii TaxID=29498 RepID=UPI001EFE020C|nr:ati2 chaperone [Vibrio tubiashii]MCG9575775.1 ati2 chaperone [Vibrio tubiashii]
MDIYQESISFLGNNVEFDDNGLFQCELSPESGIHDEALFLTIFKNEATINLHVSITSPIELPIPMPDQLAVALGEQALEPFRGGFGIGLISDSRRLSIYKIIALSNKPQGYVQNTLQQLLDKVEQWHQFIEQVETSTESIERPNSGIFI